MRIIDSNKDYYDFWQNIWRDSAVVFDRRDSYELSREEFAKSFTDESYKWSKFVLERMPEGDSHKYVLLQVCSNFWLFDLLITKTGTEGVCTEYELHRKEAWQDYSRPPELIRLSSIRAKLQRFYEPEITADDVRRGEYRTVKVFDEFVKTGSNLKDGAQDVRHIPILKDIGVAAEVPAEEIFLALEEYFLTQKRSSERTETRGLTDRDKVTNHGFDAKTSFRGKVQ